MKTPKHYIEELRSENLSDSLISDVIYSVSKRAKNWRDKKDDLINGRWFNHYEAAMNNCEENISRYYGMKDVILSECGIAPKEIHCVKRYTRPFLVCRNGCHDYHIFQERIDDPHNDEWVENPCKLCHSSAKKTDVAYKRTDYFIYWEFGERSFHKPISEDIAEKSDLVKIELDELYVPGQEIDDLLSVQFCQKVYNHYLAS